MFQAELCCHREASGRETRGNVADDDVFSSLGGPVTEDSVFRVETGVANGPSVNAAEWPVKDVC